MTAVDLYRKQFTARKWRILMADSRFVGYLRRNRFNQASSLATILLLEDAARRAVRSPPSRSARS